ncbi:uncharacterized protein LOC109704673, partial [Ananas comosus]|uniref:Uncharacterized protein LOC109704673 n=1 Tax=Ananas comosus TaxID=4615 RepID=A0A6P5EHX0_ANACO
MAESRDEGKKRAVGGAGGQSNAKKLPRYPRQQSKSGRPFRCVICGGDHRPPVCPQREEKCFKCGQPGHMSRECPSWGSSAPTSASVPYTARQQAGLPPALSAGRSSSSRSGGLCAERSACTSCSCSTTSCGGSAPVTAIPPTASGSSAPIFDVLEAEQEPTLAAMTAFKRFNPPTFNGDVKDPWMTEN